MSIFIGEGKDSYKAMQGPCDSGFHIPMESERQTIKTAIETRWSGNGAGQVTALKNYLKIPLGGRRQSSSGAVTGQGTSGRYWTCTGYSSTASRCYNIASSSTSWGNNYQALGCSIRPFKDTPVIPDSNRTVEYQGTGTAGIYSNSTLGLVSLSTDGTNRITIADKNVGATTTYSYLDTLSESNCGKYFQRGNCYGFAWTGSITTSTTLVDTSNYGPGNYYYGSSFIRSSTTWASTDNRNLRGGVTGITKNQNVSEIYIGDGNNYSAMQGPCSSGYHVPSSDERTSVINVRTSLGGLITDTTNFCIALKLPLSGRRRNNATAEKQGEQGRYRCNEITSGSVHSSNILYLPTDGISTSGNYRSWGEPVRAFKDVQVVPTSGWTKLYGTSIEAGGIFWSSTDGLISLSSDGTTWITIADKNVGATTVWNNGDTLSESNCGNYFQRGNNYGFPFTGTIGSTSGSLVNADLNGPGNYYSSSTFITRSGSPYRWDSGNNANLWGATTGITKGPNVKEVYVGSTKIRPVIRAEFTDWDADVESAVTAALLQGDIDDAILNLFGETFYISLDDDIGSGSPLDELGWLYDTIIYNNDDDWFGLQISDGGDMTDVYIEPYGYQGATDAVCIVWDNDDWGNAEYLIGTVNGDGFDFQLSSLATHFSGKDTVCMFIFKV